MQGLFQFSQGTYKSFLEYQYRRPEPVRDRYRQSELVSPAGKIFYQTLRTVNTATRNQTSYLSGGSRYNLSDQTFLKAEVKLVPFQRTKDETIELDNQYLDINKQEKWPIAASGPWLFIGCGKRV